MGWGTGVAVLYLDALHADVVDDANYAPRACHGQQRVAGVGVVGPRTRVEVLICLSTSGQVKRVPRQTQHLDLSGMLAAELQTELPSLFSTVADSTFSYDPPG